MISPARLAAYEVLTAVAAGKSTLPAAIARERPLLRDERDRALATEIATGVHRQRAAIDHLIARFSSRTINRIDPQVLEILRLGVYQLAYLGRVPPAAVVSDAVELARRAGKASAGGFVNAVLRTATRNRQRLPLPAPPADPSNRDEAIRYLSTALSHPDWLASRWYDRFGFDAAAEWMTFNNSAAPLTLRANRRLITPEALRERLETFEVTASPGRFAPDALVVESGQPLKHRELDGLFVVQDEASQLVALLAGPDPGHRVLDACASPGGKATALAASMREDDRMVACDVRERRMALLRRTVVATRVSNVRPLQADLLHPLPFARAAFDCVIVDAPCSGLGTLRRDPDIRWRRHEADLIPLALAERRMLRHAAEVVAPGGRLVYATCSSEPEENEQVAAGFLEESPGFKPVDARLAHPALPVAVVDERGHLRTAPDRHGLEAFFGAVFERN